MTCHFAKKHICFNSFVFPPYKNDIFVDKMDQDIISINNDTGNSFLGWELAKKCDQGLDRIWDENTF